MEIEEKNIPIPTTFRATLELASLKWELTRICETCGKKCEQSLDSYLRWSDRSEAFALVIPPYALLMTWSCSDCILERERKKV